MTKRVLYIQYTNPGGYPPLQHSSKILADAGWQVLFLGTGASGAGGLDFPPHERIAVKRMPFEKPGWKQKMQFLRFFLWVMWTAVTFRPRWIYASDPLSCPAALALTFLPWLAVIYHEHDMPADHANDGFFALVMRARRRLARRARMCILPNRNRLARFEREFGPLRAAACVWNCPGLYEVPRAAKTASGDSIWLLYHGTLVPERLSPVVIDALALLPEEVKLRAVGYETVGAPGYVAKLRSCAESIGVGHRVEFLPPVSRPELLPVTMRSDIGLALIPVKASDFNFEAMAGASNKVFDYMACGLPVLVSALPEWCELFVRPGYGLACDPADAHSIASAIRTLVEDRAKMRAMGEAGRRQILEHWNYEAMFAPVLALMSGAAA
ncbi:MAG TPA: glycosyltransferase family 4 protein [Bryobacteraceae bacterium]|nr:glycosyltransferase family 4 protein [Bryobacteraceae bacterium]